MSHNIRKETFLNPEDYPEDQRRLVENFNNKLKTSMGIITGIGKEYHTIWLMDRKTRSMELYRSTGQNTVSGLIELGTANNNYDDFIKAYVNTYVADRPESVLRDISFNVVSERILTGDLYTVDYMRINDDSSVSYHQMAFALAGEPDSADKIILAFKDVDKVIRRHMADKLYLREQLNIVNALSRDYYNIFKIDIETGNVVILKLDGYVTKGMDKPSEKLYPYDTLYRQYVTDRVYSEDNPSMMEAMSLPVVKEKLEKNNEYVSSYRVMDGGEIHYYQFTYIPINPLNKSAGILAAFKNVDDIVESARERDELKILAETDTMTGILNRGSGEEKISLDLASGKRGMFCVMDIDAFKRINDSYGHDVGDKVIRGIADILKGGFRERDIIFRLGGDEYAVFAPNVMQQNKGRDMINRIFESIEKLDIPELNGYVPTISVGAYIIPHGEHASFDDAYRKADEGVYKSKNTKGNSLTFY